MKTTLTFAIAALALFAISTFGVSFVTPVTLLAGFACASAAAVGLRWHDQIALPDKHATPLNAVEEILAELSSKQQAILSLELGRMYLTALGLEIYRRVGYFAGSCYTDQSGDLFGTFEGCELCDNCAGKVDCATKACRCCGKNYFIQMLYPAQFTN